MADEPGASLVEMSPASSRPVMAMVRLTWPEKLRRRRRRSLPANSLWAKTIAAIPEESMKSHRSRQTWTSTSHPRLLEVIDEEGKGSG